MGSMSISSFISFLFKKNMHCYHVKFYDELVTLGEILGSYFVYVCSLMLCCDTITQMVLVPRG